MREVPGWASALKNRLLPAGPQMRRLPVGVGRGARMEIDFRTHTKTYLGLYEIELNRFLRELCLPGADCFDVGGQSGYDALVLAKLTGGRVISFDCDPSSAARMRGTFAANPDLCDTLSVQEAFVADKTDPASQRLALDDFVFDGPGFIPDLMKVDVDGGEVEVLAGSQRILTDRRPHVVVETHSPALEQACGELLLEHGYRPTIVNQRAWLRDLRPIPHNRWLVARGRGGA